LKNYSLLELNPTTGRRHQLRVHLCSIGHPIVGDVRYGDRKLQESFSRVMLHAKSLEFSISDEKKILIEASIPLSFQNEFDRIKSL